MKKEKVPSSVLAGESSSPTELDVRSNWQRVIRRRSFLKGLGMVGATVALPAGAVLLNAGTAQAQGSLTQGDTAILRFLAAAEIIESDLWTQYAELGGVGPSGGGAAQAAEEFQDFIGGNPAYTAALQNLDGDMPQYITDNTDDELSHAAFLNAYLMSKGAEPVNLDQFRTLPSSKATGARQVGRLTNLMNLNVDLSWYTRYRSNLNPDLGAAFNGPPGLVIKNQPAIPISDEDTDPSQSTPPGVPPASPSSFTDQQSRMQAIANTAGFHFAFIEQGGSSLYATMAQKCHDVEVLRIVVSIGGVEVDHFSLWHDKAGNAVNSPLAGVTDPITKLSFPNLNNPATELTQTNKILPEPCQFISKSLPNCSVIRPSTVHNSGAVAAVQGLTADNLFHGQSHAFFEFVMKLAVAADAAQRGM
jgi:hypothetical protein